MKHIKLLVSIFVFMLLASASYGINFQNINLNDEGLVNNSFSNTSSPKFNATTNIDYSKIYYSLRDNSQDLEFNNGNLTNFRTNNGTVNGGVTISEDGAMVFDGVDGYVDTNNLIFNPNSDFTISQWVDYSVNSGQNFVWGIGPSSDNYVGFNNRNDEGLTLQYNTGGGTEYIFLNSQYSASNSIAHIVITRSGDDWTLYVNDVVYDTDNNSVSNLSTNTDQNLYFGRLGDVSPTSNYFNGKIDNVQIYDRALSSTEITEIYNAGKDSYSPIGDGLVAQYTGKDFAGNHSNPKTIYDTNYIVENNGSRGINFDGVDDYVDLGTNIGNFENNSYTLSTRIKLNKREVRNSFISKGSINDGDLLLYQNKYDGGTITFYSDQGNILLLTEDYSINTEHLVNVVYNDSNAYLYIDGDLKDSQSGITGYNQNNVDNWILGAAENGNNRFMDGSISDTKIYNRALNQTEITKLKNNETILEGLVFSQGDVNPATQTLWDRVENICIICKSGVETITNLAEKTYNIAFLAYQGASETISDFFSFTVDTTPPTITNNIPVEIKDYTLNLSQYLNITEENELEKAYINFKTSNDFFNLFKRKNISNANYTGNSLDVSAQDTNPFDLAFNNDGTKAYMVGYANDAIYEYSCTSDNINDCSYSSNSLSVSAQDATPNGLAFNNDGTKAYIVGNSNDAIYEYSCTSDNINDCSYSGNSLSLSAQDTSPVSWTFNNDGTKAYMVGYINDAIYEYSCTSDNINDCSYSGNSLSVSAQDTKPRSWTFNNDGTKAYIVGDDNDAIYEYNIPSSLNISSEIELTQNGNISYSIVAEDNAGNTIEEAGKLLVNPLANLIFKDSINDNIITGNLTLDGITFNNPAQVPYYNSILSTIGSNTVLFDKARFNAENITVTTANSGTLNQTYIVEPVTIYAKAFDSQTLNPLNFNVVIENSSDVITLNNLTTLLRNYDQVPTGDIELTFSSANYENAKYFNTLTSESSLNFSVYLTPINSSGLVQFQVNDFNTGAGLSNVLIEAQKVIGNNTITVQTTKTTSSGSTYLYLDPLEEYKLIFNKDKYAKATVETTPGVTSYTVRLKEDTTSFIYIDDVSYRFIPSSNVIYKNITYNYSAFIAGTNFRSIDFSVKDSNGNIITSQSSSNPSGTTFIYENLITESSNITKLFFNLTYEKGGKSYTQIKEYRIQGEFEGFLAELRGLGENDSEEYRLLKFFIVVTTLAGFILLGVKFNETRDFVSLIVILPLLAFTFIEWIPLYIGLFGIIVSIIFYIGGNKR